MISEVAETLRNFGCRPLRVATRHLVDCPIRTTSARAQPTNPETAFGQVARQMSGYRLDIPAGAQARSRQLCIVEFVE
jgi:hypothetical protein